jgi:hypothetical protein
MEITIMTAQNTTTCGGYHHCVGIDLHKDTMTICTLRRGSGDVEYRKIPC